MWILYHQSQRQSVRVNVTWVSDDTCDAVYCRVAALPDVIVITDVSSTLHAYVDIVPSE